MAELESGGGARGGSYKSTQFEYLTPYGLTRIVKFPKKTKPLCMVCMTCVRRVV